MTKREKKQLTRETKMDIVNSIMVVIACILYAILIYSIILVSQQYENMLSAIDAYIFSTEEGNQLLDASGYLTNQARHYVVDGKRKHVDNYFEEVHVTRRRENALKNLAGFADEEAISAFQKALDESNQLMETEIYAMRLVAEAQEEDISTFPEEVQKNRLTAEDQKLSPGEMMGRARLLLFDENYQHATEEIAADVSSFLNEVIGDTDNKRQESMIKMKKIMTIQSILFGVLIVQSLAMIAMILINNRIKQKENLTFINQIIHAFARSIDIKDKYTNGHSMRVAKYAKLIAKKAGFNSKEAEALYNIGLLHDIGKIIIPDHILNKSGRLTDDEYKVVKRHTSTGADILKEIQIAPEWAIGARYHHERIDGKGYPTGKSGDEIPEIAQIIAVADTFDAMYSDRPYLGKMPIEEVVSELKRCAGTQLNEKYVKVLLQLISEGAVEEISNT